MKSKRSIFVIFTLVLIVPSILYSAVVTQTTAEQVAMNWYSERNDKAPNDFSIIESFIETENADNIYYIFNFDKTGFVIVSADDIAVPILGYVFEHNYTSENHPPQFEAMLASFREQILYAKENDLSPPRETRIKWNRLKVTSDEFISETTRAVGPLLSTTWNQGQYYNEMCPADGASTAGNGFVWAGCTATATSQVMKYHAHPTTGEGSHSYTWAPYGTLSANFGVTTYNWALMPNNVTSSNIYVQTLLYHVGVGAEMQYGPTGSGAWIGGAHPATALSALQNNFKYDLNSYYDLKVNHTVPVWDAMLKNELDNNRPLVYEGYSSTGSGHAFVLDGYQGFSDNHYHFNWGWSGAYDGYFYLTSLIPSAGYDYTYDQAALFGVEPRKWRPLPDVAIDVSLLPYTGVDLDHYYEGPVSMLNYSVLTDLTGQEFALTINTNNELVFTANPVVTTNVNIDITIRATYTGGIADDTFNFIITGASTDYDWGDAPDPTYPTLASSSGAYHQIVAGVQLGSTIDSEQDGQPDATATGDDNDGNNDDDGVVFTSTLIPGSMANVTVTASVSGILDAWIDFDGNGFWHEPGEQIFVNQSLTAGANNLSFTVPASAAMGTTYARFRFNTIGVLGMTGLANNGEVEDYEVEIGENSTIKWEQLPDLTENGMDVTCSNNDMFGPPVVLADDFLCTTTGPITDIHVWGSWWQDILPEDFNQLIFHLGIYEDIPDPDGEGPLYSMPGSELWIREFYFGEYDSELYHEGPEGWFDPLEMIYVPIGDTQCWLYNFYIDEAEAFIQEGSPDEPVVYWLQVQAEFHDPMAMFGWKTSETHWNDDAVWGEGVAPFMGPWNELIYPPDHQYYPDSIDLAFRITTTPEEPEEIDFGDAPDGAVAPQYPTLLANDGARHTIDYQIYMGASIDPENNGQPDAAATGDDNDGNDDEDGVTFTSLLNIGQLVNVDITVSVDGIINAWIDFDINGDWLGANEQIFTDISVTAGSNTLSFNVPTGIAVGTTFARFRFDTAGGLTFTGLADDGEVEDYMVDIVEEITYEYDFGDAPEGQNALAYPAAGVIGSFPTCITVGPVGSYVQHGFGENWAWFGPMVDLETDGNAGSCPGCFPPYDVDECFNDSDAGLMFPDSYTIDATGAVIPCTGATGSSLGVICNNAIWGVDIDIDVTNNMPVDGFVNVLIDWNQNGQWQNDATTQCAGVITPEHVLVDFGIPSGHTGPLSSLMPIGSFFQIGPNIDYVWVRFSITESQVGNDWDGSGVFEDGESEDYLLYVRDEEPEELDFGDAPDDTTGTLYPTLVINDGARHILDGVTYLGTSIDSEPDGQQTANADGDDNDGNDDEDGIIFNQIMTGSPAQVNVTTSTSGYFSGWMDFDGNGSWDAAEQIFYDVYIHFAGTICLNYYVPATATTGNTFARFRFDTIGGLGVTGLAGDGEVEDYSVDIIEDPYMKWSQLPCEELPGLHCHDYIDSSNDITIADDWLCNGGLVTDIHWWGNYEAVNSGISHFHLSIHTNDPAICLPNDPEVWGVDVPLSDVTETATGMFSSDGNMIYSYDYVLSNPFPQTAGQYYWLDISAHSNNPNNYVVWRWQESSRSVAPILCPASDRTPPTNWQWIDWLTPAPTRYSDMAFEITSCPPSIPLNFTISKVGTNMTLQWDPDPCSIYYNVYSSTDPYATFPGGWTLEAYNITTTTWNDPISTAGSKKFYHVTAEN